MVFQIIGVFPNVAAEYRFTFAARDCLAHDRIVLICGGTNFEFATIDNEPSPAAAETGCACGFKFFFESVEAAESGFDVVGEFA